MLQKFCLVLKKSFSLPEYSSLFLVKSLVEAVYRGGRGGSFGSPQGLAETRSLNCYNQSEMDAEVGAIIYTFQLC